MCLAKLFRSILSICLKFLTSFMDTFRCVLLSFLEEYCQYPRNFFYCDFSLCFLNFLCTSFFLAHFPVCSPETLFSCSKSPERCEILSVCACKLLKTNKQAIPLCTTSTALPRGFNNRSMHSMTSLKWNELDLSLVERKEVGDEVDNRRSVEGK